MKNVVKIGIHENIMCNFATHLVVIFNILKYEKWKNKFVG